MTRIIPREFIQHLEWNPSQPEPKPLVPPTDVNIKYFIDDIVKGKTFYSEQKDTNGSYIGLPIALEEALSYTASRGIIATMPEFIAAKAIADNNHDFWKKWYAVHTEENIGIDKKGRFYKKNEPVLVLVNGGGILTPNRIRQAYADGLVGNAAKYREEEFADLLNDKLPDGKNIQLYKFEDVKKGISNPLHQFGVVMPYSLAQSTKSAFHQKKQFLENPLVIARTAGSLHHLETYFDKAQVNETVGNWHPFEGRDASVPQGRLLFVSDAGSGLGGYYLDSDGRFVGVAPEVQARKNKDPIM